MRLRRNTSSRYARVQALAEHGATEHERATAARILSGMVSPAQEAKARVDAARAEAMRQKEEIGQVLASLKEGDKVTVVFEPRSSSSPDEKRAVVITGTAVYGGRKHAYFASGRVRSGNPSGGAIMDYGGGDYYFQPTMAQGLRRIVSMHRNVLLNRGRKMKKSRRRNPSTRSAKGPSVDVSLRELERRIQEHKEKSAEFEPIWQRADAYKDAWLSHAVAARMWGEVYDAHHGIFSGSKTEAQRRKAIKKAIEAAAGAEEADAKVEQHRAAIASRRRNPSSAAQYHTLSDKAVLSHLRSAYSIAKSAESALALAEKKAPKKVESAYRHYCRCKDDLNALVGIARSRGVTVRVNPRRNPGLATYRLPIYNRDARHNYVMVMPNKRAWATFHAPSLKEATRIAKAMRAETSHKIKLMRLP